MERVTTRRRRHAQGGEWLSIWSYLLASDDTIRAEITEAERQARISFEDATDRKAWLESEREVREHRRWRYMAWALVFGPAFFVFSLLVVGLAIRFLFA